MPGPKTPPKRSLLQRIGACLCGLPFAVFVTVALDQNPKFHPIIWVVFIGAFCVSALVMDWLFFARTEELRKKLPISSKELQRKTKEFYDNLPRS